jgi:hypothetical protein
VKTKSFTVLAIAAGLLLPAANARAYHLVTCGGEKLKWPGDSANVQMTRNLCSVPDGSTQAAAYFSAIDRWNQVGGMWDKLAASFAWDPSHCEFTIDDGWNDFALVDVAEIDGALGRSFVIRSCPDILGVDIAIANLTTQNFANPDEAFATVTGLNRKPLRTGQHSVLHEFGHALGLSIQPHGSTVDAHATGFSIMRATPPGVLAGGLNLVHSRVMPDDAAGARVLYPSGKNEFNLMASAQSLSGGSIVNNAPWKTVDACRGASLTFTWTLLNAGTTTATCDQRFFMAPSPTAHNDAGITLAVWQDATVFAESVVSPSVTVAIPCGTPTGLYWLYHQVDSSNKFGEWNESDNVVHNPATIQVNNCGC